MSNTVLKKQREKSRKLSNIMQNKALYVMVLPALVFFALFNYWPMYGVQIAFRNFSFANGITGSKWVGMKWFNFFFKANQFPVIVRNTLLLSLYDLAAGFPFPILLALIMHNVPSKRFRRITQTATYMPHFISLVVVCGMVRQFCLSDGLFNQLMELAGIHCSNSWLQIPEAFRTIYIGSDIWQSVGWNSIIYLAAIAGVDSQLYEAAEIDGAGRWKKLVHITFPTIRPTIILLLIMQVGKTMNVGYEKILLLYNSTVYDTADVISTYVYRKGLLDFDYSYSTAVNLFNSVINFILVIVANKISSKLSETSLF